MSDVTRSGRLTPAQVGAYLARIGVRGPVTADASGLAALHRAHLYAVPFENLDIHPPRREIVLDVGRLFEKIVERRRGGFCYELNGLFAALLRALGFQVDMLSAGVARREGGFGPEFDHMALRVRLDDDWLADVGFGESFRGPLRLVPVAVQAQPPGEYRLRRGAGAWVYESRVEGVWQPSYRFTLRRRGLAAYAAMCTYHQTSPVSTFTQGRLCSIATPDGRVTMRDRVLILTTGGRREERPLADDAAFAAELRARFGIVLGE